jgi:DNA-binding transcriptional LysR family regulator
MAWLNHMAHFAAVVRNGSFTAAAEQLAMPKSTVSQRVAELEAALGTTLLVRTTRRLHLTEAGRLLLSHCEKLADFESAAFEEVLAPQRLPRGKIKVTAPNVLGSIVLAPFVAAFLARYRNVEVEFDLTDGVIELHESNADIAIRIGSATVPRGYRAAALGDVQFHLCAASIYLAAHRAPSDPDELTEHACLPHRGRQQWVLTRAGRTSRVNATGRMLTDNLIALKEACMAGQGIAALPFYLCTREYARDELVPVLSD